MFKTMIAKESLTKLYYSIGEVAKMFDLNPSNIRFWEKEFSQLQPKKNKKGDRKFSPNDILLIQRIYQLTHEDGFTLEGAKKALKNKTKQSDSVEHLPTETSVKQAISQLEAIKFKLLNWKE